MNVVDEINELFLKHWECLSEAVSISVEEFSPELWKEQVEDVKITPNEDKMMILNGQKSIEYIERGIYDYSP